MNTVIRNAAILIFLLIAGISFAEKEYSVKWVATVEQTKDDEATLVFNAKLDKGWHTYSQFTPDGGPIATAFTYTKSKSYELNGKTAEPRPDEAFDKDFGVKVLSFK